MTLTFDEQRKPCEQELDELTMTEPGIKQAADALRWVSNDEKSRQLALDRELSERAFRHTMAAERQEGRAEGRDEGRRETLQLAVETACELLGIEIDFGRGRKLADLGVDELSTLLGQIRSERRLPVDL